MAGYNPAKVFDPANERVNEAAKLHEQKWCGEPDKCQEEIQVTCPNCGTCDKPNVCQGCGYCHNCGKYHFSLKSQLCPTYIYYWPVQPVYQPFIQPQITPLQPSWTFCNTSSGAYSGTVTFPVSTTHVSW